MVKLRVILLFVFFIASFNQLLSQKVKITAEEYIEKYNSLATEHMQKFKIPASITLAQGLHESDCGNSKLAKEAKNHFGIKCHKSWTGDKIYKDDDAKNECFRKYNTVEQSFLDHSEFLKNTKRYAFLFDFPVTDYKAWAHGLKKAGYATNPDYPELLIKLIEKHRLYEFDNKDSNNPLKTESLKLTNEIKKNNGVRYLTFSEKNNLKTIAKSLNRTESFLKKCNDICDDCKPEAGDFVYVDKKRNKAEKQFEFHIVQKGETMRFISQKYAVKLKKLYRKNRMKIGEEAVAGTKIWLRKKKPKE